MLKKTPAATRATAARTPITMPAMAAPDREAVREAEAEAEAEVEVEAGAEAGADVDVVVEKVALGGVEGDDVARGVAGYMVVE